LGEYDVGELILILGGARSGKSTFAQHLAQDLGGEGVLFVATAEAGDDEMQARIEKHRQERPPNWRTLETPRDAGRSIMAHSGRVQVVLLDCLTLLVSNLIVTVPDPFAPEVEKQTMDELESLLACVEQLDSTMIVVSNEVGLGLVPPYRLGRAYRDLLGKANQILAQRAEQVYLMVAGIPMAIK
jgi:adenosylcobinamide kinase/adenosylcobinamide-phosphate guanylyltransferase